MNDRGQRESVLVVDDESAIRKQLRWALRDDYEVFEAADAEQAMRRLKRHPVDLVLLDLRFPPHAEEISGGREILQSIRKARPTLPVIIMTGDLDRNTAVEMVARGAFDLFRKPVDLAELRVIVKRALRIRQLEQENRDLRNRLDANLGIEGLVGKSKAMQELAGRIRRVADTSATVLITGESGTGKELVARALHQLGARREKPFVALNCGTIPSNLIDDELFGHEKGAYTGAATRRAGKFEFADGGTLFLDEIGDLPESVQIKLLRVLQESEIQRLGGNETVAVDVRVVTATHRDLEQRCRDGAFREDLYYRLKVVQLAIPPLRQRIGDVALLAGHFLSRHAESGSPTSLSPEAIRALSGFDWPGNVRQLENTIIALCATGEDPEIELRHLPPEIRDAGEPATATSPSRGGLDLAAAEREMIRRALARTSGNRTHAAGLLGVSRHVLLGKLKRHGLDD